MKRTFVRVPLVPHNEQQLDLSLDESLADSMYLPLLRLIAQACDLKAQGEDVWIYIGTDSNTQTLLLTLNDNKTKSTAGGGSLTELAVDCERLL